MQLVELRLGDQLLVAEKEWKRTTGEKPTEVRQRVADFCNCGLSTIRNLTDLREKPDGLDTLYRTCVYVLALGAQLEDFGLSEADLPRGKTVKNVLSALRSHQSTWRIASPKNATTVAA